MAKRVDALATKVAVRPLGSVCASNGALTSVLLDSGLVPSWEPRYEGPLDDDLGGHPQRVIDLLDADARFVAAPLRVGKGGKALVLDLEGISGEAEVYHLPDGTLALVEPTLSWWRESFPKRAADIQALFEDAFDPSAKTKKVGSVAVPSGKLAIFDSNADLTPAEKARSALAPGALASFGRDGDGVFVGVPRGTYAVGWRVIKPAWAKKNALVVARIGAPKRGAKRATATVSLSLPKPAEKSAPAKAAPKPPRAKKRSSVVFVPSPELAAIVGGTTPLTLGEVHAKIREYVDRNKLEKPRKPFTIYPDAKLGKILGEKPVSIFALAQPVNKHLSRVRA